MCFRYHSDNNRNGQGGVIKRPVIEIVIKKDPESADASQYPAMRLFGLVDSGADIFYIPQSIATTIGLDLDETTVKTTKSASGEFSTYRTTMYVEIIHKKGKVDVGLVDVAVSKTDPDAEDVKEHVLIGRRGFFDKYKVTFNDTKEILHLSRINHQ